MRYDPVADSWTSLAPSPDYYFAAPAVYFNGKIYIFGGYDETFQPTNTTRIYDIGTNTWSSRRTDAGSIGRNGHRALEWNRLRSWRLP